MIFRDRTHAGQELARKLRRLAGQPNVLVLALPRGGVPVAAEVARALRAPLDVFVVRKLGVPGQPEFAMGALATGGVRVLQPDVVQALAIPDAVIDAVTATESEELRRERAYRGTRPAPRVAGRPSFSWTTAWRPARPCAPRSRRCGAFPRRASWWPCPWARP